MQKEGKFVSRILIRCRLGNMPDLCTKCAVEKQFLVATVPPADVAGVGEQRQWGVMSTPEQGV